MMCHKKITKKNLFSSISPKKNKNQELLEYTNIFQMSISLVLFML